MTTTSPCRGPSTEEAPFRAVCTREAIPASVPFLRRFAGAALDRWELSGEVRDAVAVVVAELVTNVVVHTTSDDVTLCLGVRDDVLKIEVRDRGYWRPEDHDRPDPAPAHAEGGRGLDIVAAYSGVPAVRATAAGTTVSTDLRLRSRPGTG
ncbi:ATP-binding protein [Streptomyces sp. Wh19]|uniref:ATP-binding protein n=1 Tax=Streptomyces sp. Wh19 TaxID=3076629 RepID=UPI002958A308|nr:ATP-binding protein [Streptomyces sp. Wh19]MDV9197559.1 ATP-binding protein [Streptomyces sp. Wh19]